jgi:hypothetical protein
MRAAAAAAGLVSCWSAAAVCLGDLCVGIHDNAVLPRAAAQALPSLSTKPPTKACHAAELSMCTAHLGCILFQALTSASSRACRSAPSSVREHGRLAALCRCGDCVATLLQPPGAGQDMQGRNRAHCHINMAASRTLKVQQHRMATTLPPHFCGAAVVWQRTHPRALLAGCNRCVL